MLLLALPLAVLAGIAADGDPPKAALGSEILWRLMVTGGALLAAYLPIMTLWLAYQGRWLDMAAGGGAKKGEPVDDADAMGSAAQTLRQVGSDINRRLDLHGEDIRELAERVAALEDGM